LTTVEPTPAGLSDSMMQAIPTPIHCLQWHGAEVKSLPADGVVLATNTACSIQAARIGTKAYGLQYHVEVTASTVPEWSAVPAYATSLATTLGEDGARAFATATTAALPNLTAGARIFWQAYLAAVGLH
ncbi:MAG: hypothetical protein JXQ84_01530, partial [Rhodospirillaceae bacterium]|nr:hypothetical protein [Rhodospirillaceae bacterium]